VSIVTNLFLARRKFAEPLHAIPGQPIYRRARGKTKAMKPYYEHAGITIYHGNSVDILPQVDNVDLVLTDPPYGVGVDYEEYFDSKENLSILIRDAFVLMRQKCVCLAITSGVGNMFAWPVPDWTLCWAISGAGSTGKWGFACWQPILVYGADPYLSSGRGRRPDLIFCNEKAVDFGHPCSKPIGLWKRILDRCTLGNTILDPFMGSGTTLVAAKDMGKKAVGIELSERYCEIAAERLSQEVIQFGEDARAGHGECPGTACNSASMQVALDI
jgi:DNA modification methylase